MPMNNIKVGVDLLWNHIVPNMRLLFMMSNPEDYHKWQGNCCRQAAVMACYAMMQRGVGIESMVVVERKFLYKIPKQQPLSNHFETFEHAFLKIVLSTGYMCVDVSLKQEKPICAFSGLGHYDSLEGNLKH